MMKIKYLIFSVSFLFCSALLIHSASGQITQTTIPVAKIGVINFQDLAEREALNPPKTKARRDVEADEEKHRGIPKNRALPTDAVRTEIELPQTSYRSPLSPAATVSFNGMLDNGSIIPPDVNGV